MEKDESIKLLVHRIVRVRLALTFSLPTPPEIYPF
jgi:hypothetical protein